jgi:hypothetical protein
MSILKQIEAKAKAFQVIQSCQTTDQLTGAKNYIELYNEKYEDLLGYQELTYVLEDREEILNR